MKKLKVKEIERARVCVLQNAQSLFEEAVLLEKHGFYARSYTLAHICNEELSKIPMLVGTVMDIINGDSVDWKKLSRRLTNHIEKLNAMHMQYYLSNEIPADNSDVTAYEDSMKSTPRLNDDKNNSLYAGVVNNKFTQPSLLFNKEKVAVTLAQVKERLEYFVDAESKTVGNTAEFKEALASRSQLKKLI